MSKVQDIYISTRRMFEKILGGLKDDDHAIVILFTEEGVKVFGDAAINEKHMIIASEHTRSMAFSLATDNIERL